MPKSLLDNQLKSSFSFKAQQNGNSSEGEALICFHSGICLCRSDIGTAWRPAGQVGTGETVIQKATEQFESSPLKTISLDKGIWMFSGDGGNVTAIVDDGSTLLIDSALDSRASELTDAIFKATRRPVTRLVNTHWHFDHTGGNVYFGSSGVSIIAQENVKNRLSSVQNVPFIGLRDGRYPTQALPTVGYSRA